MNYLKPFRRKLGAVTLLMACVFTVGWVRSLVMEDHLTVEAISSFATCDFLITGLATEPHALVVMHRPKFASITTPSLSSSITEPPLAETSTPNEHDSSADDGVSGEVVGGGSASFGTSIICCFPREVPLANIPFWSIVIPLTVLSAWLLLSKPRQAKPQITATASATSCDCATPVE